MMVALAPESTYVCLLSDNVLPNIIPLADPSTRPRKIVLVTSQGHEERVRWFKQATEGWNLEIHTTMGNPYSYDAMHTMMSHLVQLHDRIVVNVTGGTKLMALAAFDVCHGQYPVMYVDSQNKTIQILDPGINDLGWPQDLKIKRYLGSYGYTVISKGSQNTSAAWRQVGEELANCRDKWYLDLINLNWMASARRQDFRRPMLIASRDLTWLLEEHGLIERAGQERWKFTDEDARDFLNGTWFESYVFSRLRHMQRDLQISELTINLVVSKNGVKNELDIVFISGNRLYIIECKTKNFDRDGTAQQMHPVYKLDSTGGHVGGLMGKSLLMSYHPLTPAVRRRCQEVQIAYIDSTRAIDTELMKWIRGS